MCVSAWVIGAGLVTWAVTEIATSTSLFTDRLLVACSTDCLGIAQHAHGRGRHRWSEPMPVAEWLNALRASLEFDPVSTPIGELAGVG